MSRLDDLAAWDPAQGDLPDDLAAALDTDPDLRAAFDARFAPATLPETPPMPGRLAARLRPPTRRRLAPWFALAAAATLAVGLVAGDPSPLARYRAARLAAEVERQEAALRDDPDGEYSAQRERDGANLSALGYISHDLGEEVATARRAEAERRAREALGYPPGTDAPTTGSPVGGAPPDASEARRTDGGMLRGLGYLSAEPAPDPARPAVARNEAPVGAQDVEVSVEGHVAGGVAGGVIAGVPAEPLAVVPGGTGVGPVLTQEFLRQVPVGRSYAQSVQLESSGGETYTDYGRNPRQAAAADPLSTFAVDVDTASYTVVRRKLRAGDLPPAAAVRVEEILNRFHYADPAPTGGPFAVRTEGAPSPWQPGTHLVRIGLQGRAPGPRRPSHLTFLVDTSGSMTSEDKLGLVQYGLRALVEQLGPSDTVAIVAYAGSAGVVLEPTPGSEKGRILAAIDRLRAGGSTAMGAGIQLAYDLAEQSRHDGHTHRVILLSDGDANVGETRHGALTDSIRSYAARGIALTTVGVGTGNYRDTTMEQLANDGDGTYVYLDSREEARRVFVDELPTTLDVLARDVKIQVSWDPSAVTWYRLVGYENRDLADADFRRDAVDAGEVNVGHHVTALYEVQLAPGATGSLGTVRLRYKPPGPDAPAAEAAWPVTLGDGAPSHDLQLAIAAASFAEKLRGGLPELPWARVESLAQDVATGPDERELLGLVRRAAELSEGTPPRP